MHDQLIVSANYRKTSNEEKVYRDPREDPHRKVFTFLSLFFPCPISQKCCSRKAWATIEASPCPNLPSASSTQIPPQQYRTLVKTGTIYQSYILYHDQNDFRVSYCEHQNKHKFFSWKLKSSTTADQNKFQTKK